MNERIDYGIDIPAAEEESEKWMGFLREQIAALDACTEYPFSDIDRRRAVWGVIIDNISEDAVVGLMGAVHILEGNMEGHIPPPADNLKNVQLGVAGTWLICKKTFNEYQYRLPLATHAAFLEIFAIYDDFVRDVASGTMRDSAEIVRVGRKLYTLLHNEIRSNPQMRDDIACGVAALNFAQHYGPKAKRKT